MPKARRRTCAQCGKPFKPKKTGTTGKPSRYCSAACLVAGLKNPGPKPKPPRRVAPTVEETIRSILDAM